MSEIIHTTNTVYKKTSTGKIQQWRAWVVKTDDGYLLKVESGQTDGKLKETSGQVINEGKQKRSAKEQAIFQANSKLKKKRDEAYFDTVEQAKTQVKLLPMLAHPFTKRKHNITYPAVVQRKFDGVRCLARINNDGTVTLLSRKGKEFPHLKHIRTEVLNYNKNKNIVLDGELYSDTITFQELVGLVRRVTLKEGNSEQMLQVSLRVYDCIDVEKEQDFSERYKVITDITNGAKYLSLVENVSVKEESEIHAAQARFVEEGYEGAMVRNLTGAYAIGKRSANLQKVKTFLDNEYEIVGFTQGTGDETGCVIWVCKTKDGQEFRVRPRGTREERQEYFQNGKDYIGKMLTVRYQELTDEGIPRFPVGISIRDYE
jgi:DNA ligase-1|tara:strand:+ start:1355 stop:2473 length:1119 start_codon:yes stop_codon:yes gene_type:complete